jgi:hypothetical protein
MEEVPDGNLKVAGVGLDGTSPRCMTAPQAMAISRFQSRIADIDVKRSSRGRAEDESGGVHSSRARIGPVNPYRDLLALPQDWSASNTLER